MRSFEMGKSNAQRIVEAMVSSTLDNYQALCKKHISETTSRNDFIDITISCFTSSLATSLRILQSMTGGGIDFEDTLKRINESLKFHLLNKH